MHCILIILQFSFYVIFLLLPCLSTMGWTLMMHELHVLLICFLPMELNLEPPPSTPILCNRSPVSGVLLHRFVD